MLHVLKLFSAEHAYIIFNNLRIFDYKKITTEVKIISHTGLSVNLKINDKSNKLHLYMSLIYF